MPVDLTDEEWHLLGLICYEWMQRVRSPWPIAKKERPVAEKICDEYMPRWREDGL